MTLNPCYFAQPSIVLKACSQVVNAFSWYKTSSEFVSCCVGDVLLKKLLTSDISLWVKKEEVKLVIVVK